MVTPCPRCGRCLDESSRCKACGITWRRPAPNPHGDMRDYSLRYRALVENWQPELPGGRPRRSGRTRRAVIAVSILVGSLVCGVLAAVLVWRAHPGGTPSGELTPAEVASQVLSYTTCKGGPTLETSVGRFALLAGAPAKPRISIAVEDPAQDQYRATFEYDPGPASLAFRYEPNRHQLDAETGQAATILQLMAKACEIRP